MAIESGFSGTLSIGYTALSSATGTLGAHVVTVLTSATAIAVLKIAAAALLLLATCYVLYKIILFTAIDQTKAANNPPKTETEQFTDAKNRYETLKETINALKKNFKPDAAEHDIKILHSTLLVLKCQMKHLSDETLHFQNIYNEKIKKEDADKEILSQYSKMSANFEKLNADYQELFNFANSHTPPKAESNAPLGLANTGGTCCYINSSLQPLLASKYFLNLIPETIEKYDNESEEDFEGRNNILIALKAFIEAWKSKESSYNLGKSIENFRSVIFKAGLDEGGFDKPWEEKSLCDAGSVYELILHVIGQKFELEIERTFPLSNGKTYNSIEKLPQGTIYFTANGSIQEKIDQYFVTTKDELDEPLKLESGEKVIKFTETTKIASAPELLVVRLQSHSVNLDLDQYLDCSNIFKKKPTVPIQYELVGFSQNHGQFHWTSVVSTGKDWHYCNDCSTYKINNFDGSDFKYPANYLLYQRM